MMSIRNRRQLRLLFVLSALFLGCALHKKVRYNLPPDLTGDKRKAALEELEKGRKLYEEHCSQCHGIYGKGKSNAPNFTDRQLDSYTVWAISRDPRNHAVAAHLSAEQLHEIVAFLKYRKTKSNHADSAAAQVPRPHR